MDKCCTLYFSNETGKLYVFGTFSRTLSSNKCEKMSDDRDWAPVTGGLGFLGGLLVGIMTTVWLLVVFPQSHKKLTKYIRVACPCLGLGGNQKLRHLEMRPSRRSHEHDYSEIHVEDRRIRTMPANLSKRTYVNGFRPYEECSTPQDKDRYSDLDTPGAAATATASNNAQKLPRMAEQKAKEDHTYFILEPGSDKRIPVKHVADRSRVLENDSQRVYFILEPGTNKVTLLSAFKRKTMAETPDPNYEPVYFVLEPNTDCSSTDVEPYAVNDLMEDHSYFILEKFDVHNMA